MLKLQPRDVNLESEGQSDSGGKDVGSWSDHHPVQGMVGTTVTPATNRSGADPRTPWGTLPAQQNTRAHCKEDLHVFTYKSRTETGNKQIAVISTL